MTVCILTDKSLPNAILEITYGNGNDKTAKLSLVRTFLDSQKSNKDKKFLFPENNYSHWKLDESRHGFPQKIVYRNIKNGKMENVSKVYKEHNQAFLLPGKNELCTVLLNKAPYIVFTYDNSFTSNCLESNRSIYKQQIIKYPNEYKIKVFKRSK